MANWPDNCTMCREFKKQGKDVDMLRDWHKDGHPDPDNYFYEWKK